MKHAAQGSARTLGIVAALTSGASFGFFYSWVITMWGLDAAAPEAALASMVAVNEIVRNPLFIASFVGAPVATALAAVAALLAGRRRVSLFFAGAFVGLLALIVVTSIGNLPLNRSIALLEPADYGLGAWAAYSSPWQVWNGIRAALAGIAVLLCSCGLLILGASARGGGRSEEDRSPALATR